MVVVVRQVVFEDDSKSSGGQAGFLLPSGLGGGGATQFGIVPMQGPGGTVMYQMPQGVVYAADPSGGGGGGGQTGVMVNVGDLQNGGQFITIPMPLSLAQMTVPSTASPPVDS